MRRYLVSALVVLAIVLPAFSVSTPASAMIAPRCTPAHLKLTHGFVQGAAGTYATALIFTNVGPGACSVFGVPAVQPIAHARPVGPPAKNTSMGMMPAIHVLQPRQSVSSLFTFANTANYPAASCKSAPASAVRVTLGAFVPARSLALSLRVCTRVSSTTTRLLAPGRQG